MEITKDIICENIINIIESIFFPVSDNLNSPLISSGLLDSLKIMILVSKIEEYYNITFEAHEIDRDYMDTIEQIVTLVYSKLNDEED